jgi:hypothetical protein
VAAAEHQRAAAVRKHFSDDTSQLLLRCFELAVIAQHVACIVKR